MRKVFITLLVMLFVPLFLYSQELQVGTGLQPNPSGGGDWGANALILNFEPIGPMAGVSTPNGTIYIAINDTLSTTSGLIIRKSTDQGNTWTTHPNSITNRINFPRLKMLAMSNDSVLCWFTYGTQVYRWNIMTNAMKAFDSLNVNDFDVVKSSTNSVYLWITTESGGLRRWGSTDFGMTWQNTGYVASLSKNVRMNMSVTSDTLFAVYRGYLNPVPERSMLRVAKYRETAPGTIGSISFTTMTDSLAFRNEFDVIAANSNVWFYYTEGYSGAIDIKCMTSTDNGVTYSAPFLAAGNPNTDEYYFNIGISGTTTKYCDFIYYSDSLQSGGATNLTDKLMYKYAVAGTPQTFYGLSQISQYYPNWSTRNYKPIIIEVGGADVGTAWVGGSGAGRKVYWNRFLLTKTGNNESQTPASYKLSQNYPNPFNPTTNINFSISKAGLVSIKVFDILGREVSTLVSQEMNPGNYNYKFDAKNLSSGVYFYKMEVNGFSDVKRMSVIK
ncbi:MAG: T9SS type A sorting domain-containing protein [Ignavibacteriota bacterium]|nr:T9SS type A sorting domain-containing protein [Ignavibacteriota bacterium]